jgi:hypothetical protein
LIDPSVFNFIDDFADAVDEFDPARDEPLDIGPVLAFCNAFFPQFFRQALNARVRTIDDVARRAAARLRHGLSERTDDESSAVRALISWFEGYCSVQRDLEGDHYLEVANGPLESFLMVDMGRLLSRIQEWAEIANLDELEEAAAEAVSRWNVAIDELYG